MRFRSLSFLLAFALACASACVPLHAQDAPSVDAPPPESTAPVIHLDSNVDTLKVNVNLVDLYFSARDHNGFVTSLRKQDCALFEEGKPQTIKNFTQQKNLPLTIGILLDTSGSQQNVLPLEQDSGSRFLSEVLTPKDEAFLISFDVNVNLLSDFTDNARELKQAMDQATINDASSSAGVPGIGGGPFPVSNPRGTLLFDAVYLASNQKLRSETGRKILVLLTDGGDQGSHETLKTATEAAQKANAIVYVILISDREYHPAGDVFDHSVSDMNQLAHDTGGRVINVGHDGRRLEQAFDQIQDELRTQYLVSYTPQNKTADGKFRKIKIDCGKGLDIQARKGYYAIAGDTANE